MNYLLAPLHAHFDSGFGATGNAFFEAAERLRRENEATKADFSNLHLPTNYLYRHSVELFLKSAITIFHRRLKLPYGASGSDSEPMVWVGTEWKPFSWVHSVADLWAYVRVLFAAHGEWLSANTKADWTIDGKYDDLVALVDREDPRSTFFRYPSTGAPQADAGKSPVKETTENSLMEATKGDPNNPKVFALVVQDAEGEFLKAYTYQPINGEFELAVSELARMLYNLHAALRFEVCGTW